MKCIITCAGYATRLMPLTAENPKSLLPVKGKPILEHILDKIKDIEEIDEIFIVSNNKFYTKFAWWLATFSKTYNKKISIVDSGSVTVEDQKGWLHDSLLAIEQNNINEDLLLIAGDNYLTVDLSEFISFFRKKNAPCLITYVLKNKEDGKKFGIVETNDNFKILDIEEKPEEPKTNLAVVASYCVRKEDISKMKEFLNRLDKENKLNPGIGLTHFFKEIYKEEDVFAFPFQGEWVDIGTKEDYERIKD